MMYFKNIIEAVGHTPLVEMARINPNRKVKILAKLEGQNSGGSASIKDRIARYMLEKAEQSGALTKDRVILEATSGNTGIALAWLGHIKGYKVVIVMPDNTSPERRQLLKIHNADLVLTPGNLGMKSAIETAQEMSARSNRYFMPDQFTSLLNPLTHYETTGPEIIADFPYDKIDVLIAGVGTGGTIMGLARRLRETYPRIKVIGVEPAVNDNIQGLKRLDSLDALPPFVDLSLITERTVVSSQQAEETARDLLAKEGIFAGLSSGATVYQAIQTASEMASGNIVVILADGGWKYLSLDFWTNSQQK
ncbi:MAG: cysteine synthase family protein [Dehalococcoidales bacterium]|nr:cysteine synthase family protein [Dehalococcoidales bacterium]